MLEPAHVDTASHDGRLADDGGSSSGSHSSPPAETPGSRSPLQQQDRQLRAEGRAAEAEPQEGASPALCSATAESPSLLATSQAASATSGAPGRGKQVQAAQAAANIVVVAASGQQLGEGAARLAGVAVAPAAPMTGDVDGQCGVCWGQASAVQLGGCGHLLCGTLRQRNPPFVSPPFCELALL